MSRLDKGDFIVGCKYRVVRKIGSGSFGDIFLGIEISSGMVRYCFVYVPVERSSRCAGSGD